MDASKLREAIAGILREADLTTITAKKVREQLQEESGEDMSGRKKEIDGIVMELINEPPPASAKNGKRPAAEEEEEEEEEVKSKKKAKPSPATTGGGGGTGFTRTLTLSPELARVMGQERMARHEVVKQMWKIIKEKNLYDPKNKQFAVCNEELLPVFGVKRFRTFGMMKYLKNHFKG